MFTRTCCRATINRYGFNSLGADAVQDNLMLWAKRAREEPSVATGKAHGWQRFWFKRKCMITT